MNRTVGHYEFDVFELIEHFVKGGVGLFNPRDRESECWENAYIFSRPCTATASRSRLSSQPTYFSNAFSVTMFMTDLRFDVANTCFYLVSLLIIVIFYALHTSLRFASH